MVQSVEAGGSGQQNWALRTDGHRVPDAAAQQLNGLLRRARAAVLGSGSRLHSVDKAVDSAVDRAVDIAVDNFVD